MSTLTALLKNNGTNAARAIDAVTRRRRALRPNAPITGKNNKILSREEIARIRNIRALYKDGLTQQKIADRYHMGRTTVSNIVRGITYHDV